MPGNVPAYSGKDEMKKKIMTIINIGLSFFWAEFCKTINTKFSPKKKKLSTQNI